MVQEINLGTFCFKGSYFSAVMSMQDDEGKAIPFDAAIQTESKLKLYREAIEKMLKEHEEDSDLRTPEYIDDDGVTFTEGARKYTILERQNDWDTLFALQSDRIRFQNILNTHVAVQRVIDRFQDKEPFDSFDKLVLRYSENGIPYNYRDATMAYRRVIQLQSIIDP